MEIQARTRLFYNVFSSFSLFCARAPALEHTLYIVARTMSRKESASRSGKKVAHFCNETAEECNTIGNHFASGARVRNGILFFGGKMRSGIVRETGTAACMMRSTFLMSAIQCISPGNAPRCCCAFLRATAASASFSFSLRAPGVQRMHVIVTLYRRE